MGKFWRTDTIVTIYNNWKRSVNMDALKEGLSQKVDISETDPDLERHGPNQVPKKTGETVKRDGKSYKIK